MSKLAEKLKRLSENQGYPAMGFMADRGKKKGLPLLLVGRLSSLEKGLLPAGGTLDALLVEEGALDSGTGTSLPDMARLAGGVPWGISLSSGNKDRLGLAQEEGCDFVSFSPGSLPLQLLLSEGIGKVLEIDPEWTDSLAASVNSLNIDAVLIRLKQGRAFTVYELMVSQRFARVVRKPVLVAAPLSIQAEEADTLWKAGVDGLVLSLEGERPGEQLQELRQKLLSLPVSRREKRDIPLLPYLASPEEPAAVPEVEPETEGPE